MKKYVLIIFFAIAACIFTSCHNDSEEYMADITIVVNSKEAIKIDQVQATATITNLNSKQVFSSTNFYGNTLTETVLRGAYKIALDGIIRYIDKNNEIRVRPFRSTTDFINVGGSYCDPIVMQTIFTD